MLAFLAPGRKVRANLTFTANSGILLTNLGGNRSAYTMPGKERVVPHEFQCPITGETMQAPVSTINCGHTFEASAIYKWVFTQQEDRCPCCNGPIKIPNQEIFFRANDGLKKRIERFSQTESSYVRRALRMCFS